MLKPKIVPRWSRRVAARRWVWGAWAVVGLLGVASCPAQDAAQQALDDARSLAREGKYEAALEKHVWFHDNALSVRPSMYGVRLSFALSDWIALGEKYPKAREKLKAIREEKTKQLLAGQRDRDLFNDVASINGYLKEAKATVELFRQMDQTNAAFAARIFDLAEKALVETKEFALARKYLGDPQRVLAKATKGFNDGIRYSKKSTNEESSRRAYESIFTDKVVRLILILNEMGDGAEAKAIQAEALKTLDNERIRDALKK